MEKEFKFSPKDWVLVRDTDDNLWKLDIFSHLVEHGLAKYVCVGSWYKQCIPYEGNEHLLNTTDPYVEPYEPKDGDFVVIETKSNILWIAILESLDKDRDKVTTYASMMDEERDALSWGCENLCDAKDVISIRPAIEEDKQLLLSKLHENGKDWNAENKSIVNYSKTYEPKDGDFVFIKMEDGTSYVYIHHFTTDDGRIYHYAVCSSQIEILPVLAPDGIFLALKQKCIERRPATDAEREQLLAKLHEKHLAWNAENKSIVNYSKTYEPKDGDFVVVEERNEKAPGVNQWICIFMSMSDVSINFHVGLALNGSLINGGRPGNYKRSRKETFRPATEEEKLKIVEQLAKIGEKWNAETKTTVAVESSYEPKEGDFVVFIPDRVPCIGIFKRSYTDGFAYSEFHACAESVPSSTEVRLDATFRGNYKFRPAYQNEKSSLLGKLWKAHRQWDAEKHAVTYCEAWSEVRRGGIYEVWHDGKMRLALVKELTDYGYLSVFFSYDPEKQVSGNVFWDGVSVPFDKFIEVPEKDTHTALFRNFMHKTGCFYDKKSGRFYDFRKEYVDGEICWFLSYQPELNKFITNRFNLRYTLRSFLQIANGNIFRTEDQANERASELNQFLKK